jgi:hypothetical protein
MADFCSGGLSDGTRTTATMLDFLLGLNGAVALGAARLANDRVVSAACTGLDFHGMTGTTVPYAFSV